MTTPFLPIPPPAANEAVLTGLDLLLVDPTPVISCVEAENGLSTRDFTDEVVFDGLDFDLRVAAA